MRSAGSAAQFRRVGNIAAGGTGKTPLVVWLGSAESREVTGRVFEIKGGRLGISDGWRDGPAIDRGRRFEPDEIGAAVHELLAKALPPQKVFGS